MKTYKATVAAILYTSKTLSNGEHPIMIRVCYNSLRKYKSIGLSCSKKYWNKKKQEVKETHPLAVNMNTLINTEIARLKELVLDLERQHKSYSAQSLIISLTKELPSKKTLYDIFEERIAYFKYTTQKLNTATGYRTLLNIIKRYSENRIIELFDINETWLRDFECYLRTKYADTSIKKFFDCLKAIMNYAYTNRLIQENPFDHFTFTKKLNTHTAKRALGIDEMNKLMRYYYETYVKSNKRPNLETTKKHYWNSKFFQRRGVNKLSKGIDSEQLALAMFICSYMFQGLALVDMAKLKWKDLVGIEILDRKKYDMDAAKFGLDYAEEHKEMIDYIEINITRSKTSHPTRILVNAQELYFYYKVFTKGIKDDDYLFPIYNDDNPDHQFSRITYATYLINHNLKKVAQRVGINTNITFYCARHTYASMLYHANVPMSLIAQNMGRNPTDIETYLKEFDTERIIEANSQMWQVYQDGYKNAKSIINQQ